MHLPTCGSWPPATFLCWSIATAPWSACTQNRQALPARRHRNIFINRSMREIPVTGGSEPTISTRPSYNPFTSVLRPKARFSVFSSLVMKSMTVSASQVAFLYGNEVVASTLAAAQKEKDSPALRELVPGSAHGEPRDVKVGNEHFLATSLDLSGQQSVPVRLSVLGSYDEATRFLDQLNRLLLLLGLAAILVGSALVFFISHTFTRPLANLVAGVRALGRGDFHHP